MKKVLLLLIFVFVGFVGFGQTATTRVTVITHGFTLNGKLDDDDDWKKFALRLRKRTGGTVFFNNRYGNWSILGEIKDGNETLDNGTNNTSTEHKIFLYDWAYRSNKLHDGNLEACADNLFAMLCKSPIGNIFDTQQTNTSLHFIGHSRGTILLLQVAHRVLKYFSSKSIDLMTFLDPHPATAMNDVSTFDETLSLPGIYGVPITNCLIPNTGKSNINNTLIKLPSNVKKSDEYYRQDGVYECTAGKGDFDGIPITGIPNFQRKFYNATLSGISLSPVHSLVHKWYLGTIDTSLVIGNSNWYSISNGQNTVFQSPIISERRTRTGYYYSPGATYIYGTTIYESTGYEDMPDATGKISLNDMNQRSINRGSGNSTGLSAIFNGNFKYYPNASWDFVYEKDKNFNTYYTGNSIKFKAGNKLMHRYFYFPSTANKLVVKMKASSLDPNIYKDHASLNINFKDESGNDVDDFPSIVSSYSSTDDEYSIIIPSKLKGKVGTILLTASNALEIKEVRIINSSNQNLREQAIQTPILNLNATSYYDFPIDYDVNPTPLVRGERPTSFKATISNTMTSTWSGTLKMYQRKVSESGRGQFITSKLVNLAPGTGVTLDRGTDFIISEPDDYILGIYANNDDVPIDEYFFYVEDQDSEEASTPTISVSPGESIHTFGSVVVGSTDGQTFNIQNMSNTNVNITGVSITGTGFSAGTSTCCGTLAPNQGYAVQVNTSPTAATVYTGQMQISGSFTGSPITIALTSQGIYNTPPITGCLSASVSAISIQSGNTDALKQQYFGLTNNSLTGSVNITNVSFTGADASYFSYDGNLFGVPSALAPAMTTGFLVKFNNPQSTTRTYNANLVFTTNNSSCPTVTIPVSATHTPSQLTWLSPLTDETYEIGTGGTINSIPLRWQGYIPAANGNVPPVEIQYTINGGLTWTSRINNPADECTTGHNNADPTQNVIYFGINDFAGKDIQFRIKPCYENTTPWQYSAIAHVTAPGQQTLQVLYPNGYEIFNAGQNVKIKWANYIGYKAVNLSLTVPDQNGNPVTTTIVNNVSGQATEYNWVVPSGVYSEYARITVSAANISDISDYNFYIQPVPTLPLIISNINVRPEGCKTTPEGNLSLTISGAPSPYYYEIRKLSDIDNIAPNGTLTAGEYLCVVNSNNNRRTSFNFTVPKNTAFTHSIIAVNDTCSGSKGRIGVSLGNTFQYVGTGTSAHNVTFSRNGVQIYSGTNTSISNQPAGYYEVSVNDAQQCGFTENVYLDSSPGTYFNLIPTVTNTSCSGNTGAISLNIGVAQSPTYLWSSGATTQNVTNLASGQYTVKVTDGTGCVQNRTADISQIGGWTENPTSYGSNKDLKIDGNKIYFQDLNLLKINNFDVATNTLDFMTFPRLYQTNYNIDPTNIETNNGSVYVAYGETIPITGVDEKNILKINPITKQIIGRIKMTGIAGAYNTFTYINGKLYGLRDGFLDIIDFSTNTYITKTLPFQCLSFSYSAISNKIYLIGFNTSNVPQVLEFNVATSVFGSTANLSIGGYKIIINGNIAYISGDNVNGTYIQRFNISTFTYIDNLKIDNQPSYISGLTTKNSQYLYVSYGYNNTKFIDVIDLSTFLKLDRITIANNALNIQYMSINDALYIATFTNILSKITSNKFDFTTSKTDATCGQNNGSISLTMPNDGKTYSYLWSNGSITKDANSLSAGSYTVTVTQLGGCAVKKTITIIQSSTAVVVPISIPTSRCGAGSLTLGASGCAGTYNWYAASTGGTSLGVGSSYITPSISTSTTYYVNCTVGGCVSTRAAVLATINIIPSAPTIPTVTINSGQTATLTASSYTGTVTWFGANTGGNAIYTGNPFTSPTLSINTTYYAECSSNSCISPTRGSGTVTVNPISCPVPTGMQWSDTFPTSFRPYWQGISGNNYVIRYRISGATNWIETALIPCTQTGLVITILSGLTNGQTYEWQVKTVCSGTSSSNYSISTFSATYCRAATIITPTGINLTATTANVQWNSVPVNVNLRYRTTGAVMWNTANNLTSSQTWLTGLSPNTNYEVQVQTICSGGILSAFTTSINFTTLNCSNMYSLKTGSWNDISVWSCGRLPNISDTVTISVGNTITIPNGQTGLLYNLVQKGILINNGLLRFRN